VHEKGTQWTLLRALDDPKHVEKVGCHAQIKGEANGDEGV
jgi:hypothetical protein